MLISYFFQRRLLSRSSAFTLLLKTRLGTTFLFVEKLTKVKMYLFAPYWQVSTTKTKVCHFSDSNTRGKARTKTICTSSTRCSKINGTPACRRELGLQKIDNDRTHTSKSAVKSSSTFIRLPATVECSSRAPSTVGHSTATMVCLSLIILFLATRTPK